MAVRTVYPLGLASDEAVDPGHQCVVQARFDEQKFLVDEIMVHRALQPFFQMLPRIGPGSVELVAVNVGDRSLKFAATVFLVGRGER